MAGKNIEAKLVLSVDPNKGAEPSKGAWIKADFCGRTVEIQGMKLFVGVMRTKEATKRVIDIYSDKTAKLRLDIKIALNGSGQAEGRLALEGEENKQWTFKSNEMEALLRFVREEVRTGKIKALLVSRTGAELRSYIETKLH